MFLIPEQLLRRSDYLTELVTLSHDVKLMELEDHFLWYFLFYFIFIFLKSVEARPHVGLYIVVRYPSGPQCQLCPFLPWSSSASA